MKQIENMNVFQCNLMRDVVIGVSQDNRGFDNEDQGAFPNFMCSCNPPWVLMLYCIALQPPTRAKVQ